MTGHSGISNLKCDKAGPREKPYSVFDREGLYLWVTPSGGKLWRWGYRHDGKQKLMSFGKYPDVTLADARKQHGDARHLLANGVDPMAVKKEQKAQKKAKAEPVVEEPVGLTFERLTRKFFAWWKADKNAKYAANVETRLEGDIIAKIGAKRPAEITRMELVKLTQVVDARGARDIARRNLQFVRQIYEYGMNNGLLDQNTLNPAAGIRPDAILSKTVEKHFASLSIGEVPELLRKMRDYNGSALTRIAMELMALTFLRTSELIGASWSEIEWDEKVWRVPGPRMKMKKAHLVPLVPQAMTLLKRLHSISGESGRLFPSAKEGNAGVMSNNTILKALERMGLKGKMTGHGWRSVASTYLHEKGFNHDHIEMQLSHSEENKVAAAYNSAEYLEQRTEMMCAWADALDQLREK